MIINLKRQINGGEINIEIDEKEEKKAMHKALFFLQGNFCDHCKKQSPLVWSSNVAKTDDGDFIYIKRFCPLCKASSTAGEYKGGNGLFWKKFEIYNPENK